MARTPLPVRPAPRAGGFSLIELIIVIVITGVLAAVLGSFIAGPIRGFLDQARRAELVGAAQLALTTMGRDVRAALPNSVRISGGNALELLLTLDGDRYRTEPPGAAADVLDFSAADASFATFSRLGTVTGALPSGRRLAIYPLGQTGANPYVDSVMTPSTTTVTIGTTTVGGVTEGLVTLGAAHLFPFQSPRHRVFLVEGPVTWRCSGNSLTRYNGYAVTDPQPVPPTGGTASVVIDTLVESCAFKYDPGTAERNAVVSIALSLAAPSAASERVRLSRQIHIDNSP